MAKIIRFSVYSFCLGMILWVTAPAAVEPVRFVSNRIKIERPLKTSESPAASAEKTAPAEKEASVSIETAAIEPQARPAEIPVPEMEEAAAVSSGGESEAETRSIKEEIESLIGKKRRLYTRKDRIDPFEPFLKKPEPEITTSEKQILQIRPPQTPLEMIDLSQLRVTAILRAPSQTTALVEESSGKGYVVSENTYIGSKGGQISKILKDRIIVEEKYLDMFGNIAVREKELKLQN